MLVNADENVAADLADGADFGMVFANALAGPAPEPGPATLVRISLVGLGALRRQELAAARVNMAGLSPDWPIRIRPSLAAVRSRPYWRSL